MKGEEILWTGQPGGPFLSVYLGICLVQSSFISLPLYIWERFDDPEGYFPIFFVFAIVTAVLYFRERFRIGRTHHLLTNERVIVVTGADGRTIRAEFISGLPGLSKRTSLGGTARSRLPQKAAGPLYLSSRMPSPLAIFRVPIGFTT